MADGRAKFVETRDIIEQTLLIPQDQRTPIKGNSSTAIISEAVRSELTPADSQADIKAIAAPLSPAPLVVQDIKEIKHGVPTAPALDGLFGTLDPSSLAAEPEADVQVQTTPKKHLRSKSAGVLTTPGMHKFRNTIYPGKPSVFVPSPVRTEYINLADEELPKFEEMIISWQARISTLNYRFCKSRSTKVNRHEPLLPMSDSHQENKHNHLTEVSQGETSLLQLDSDQNITANKYDYLHEYLNILTKYINKLYTPGSEKKSFVKQETIALYADIIELRVSINTHPNIRNASCLYRKFNSCAKTNALKLLDDISSEFNKFFRLPDLSSRAEKILLRKGLDPRAKPRNKGWGCSA